MSSSPAGGMPDLLAAEQKKLLACVHCGFCLTTCPTYARLGNEAESPRGRLHLMRAVAEKRIDPSSPAFAQHIDACVGCRACETACPAGVEFGFLLQRARATVVKHHGMDLATRLLLWTFGSRFLTRVFGLVARLVRRFPLGRRARTQAPRGLLDHVRFGLAMLAGSSPAKLEQGPAPGPATPTDVKGPTIALLEGCAQSALFGHVNDATARVLQANGCGMISAGGQGCCGALHAHAGDLEGARRLALANLDAFERSGAELVVTNSAGCGATLKEYAELFDEPALKARAEAFSAKVRDVSELLATLGPRAGEAVPAVAAYDAPCHLQHGQGLANAPLQMLKAVPGLKVVPVARADECCGGAGIYGLLHQELGGRILADKVKAICATNAELCVTANPGCILQIAAGLSWYGAGKPVVHAIELLDESYRRAGFYRPPGD